MAESLDPALLRARCEDLEGQIRELKVRRQYAPNARYSLRLDERIEALRTERAAVAAALRVAEQSRVESPGARRP
jgi:regulator of sirC expression with transglutaminase-like and TPR domain